MSAERIHYVDWLRWAAVLAVVVFHAVLPFGSFLPWVIENDERSGELALLTALLPFAFPVFFFLAGASARHALQARGLRDFLRERTTRLVVPFVAGTLVLAPLTAYVIALHDGSAPSSFLGFLAAYPGIVIDRYLAVGFSPLWFQVGMHLWFLGWLFLFSLIASPFFAYLGTERGRSLVDRLARGARRPGTTLLAVLPLTLIGLPLFRESSTVGWDWAVFGMWGGAFLGGYVIYSDARLVAATRRDFVPALAAAAVGLGGLAATGFTTSIFRGGEHTADATYVVVVTLHALSVWGVTLSVIGAGMRAGFMQRPLSRRAGDMSLPTYLLHYPIVISISAIVVQLPLGLWAKVALNMALGLAVTFLFVASALRIPVVRVLLGVRSRDVQLAGRDGRAGAKGLGDDAPLAGVQPPI